MGLYGFYLAVCAPEEEVLSVQQVDGMDWGDAIGRCVRMPLVVEVTPHTQLALETLIL